MNKRFNLFLPVFLLTFFLSWTVVSLEVTCGAAPNVCLLSEFCSSHHSDWCTSLCRQMGTRVFFRTSMGTYFRKCGIILEMLLLIIMSINPKFNCELSFLSVGQQCPSSSSRFECGRFPSMTVSTEVDENLFSSSKFWFTDTSDRLGLTSTLKFFCRSNSGRSGLVITSLLTGVRTKRESVDLVDMSETDNLSKLLSTDETESVSFNPLFWMQESSRIGLLGSDPSVSKETRSSSSKWSSFGWYGEKSRQLRSHSSSDWNRQFIFFVLQLVHKNIEQLGKGGVKIKNPSDCCRLNIN